MSTGMVIDGVLGSEAIDSSGEVLSVKGADISDVDKGTLLLNWEHSPGEKGPSTIVGVVLHAKKIYTRDDCENDRQRMYWDEIKLPFIYGISRLYDGAGHEEAKRIAAIIRDHAANKELIVCRYSVEGSTLDKEDNRLKDSVVRRVAITVKPCNRTAVSGLIEDPQAPPGFEKKHTKEKVKDLLDFDAVEKNEDPLRHHLCTTETICNPIVEDPLAKAYTAGVASGAPGTLTGGAALQREDLGPHTVAAQARAAIRDYGHKKFDKKEFRNFAKSRMPEASDEFLDHFATMAEDYGIKRSQLIKKEAALAPAVPASKPAKPKATPAAKQKALPAPAPETPAAPSRAEAAAGPLKFDSGTIRGIPTVPNKMTGVKFDEANGVLHTPKGSFPLYNPDVGFKTVEHASAAKKPFYKGGVLHVAPGTDVAKMPQHNGPNPGFREVYNSEPIEEFHSGKVMPNWLRVHQLTKAGRLPEEVVMHSAVFSMMSPNCVDEETEALTQRGWVRGFELRLDDVLLTKNPGSGRLEWQAMTDLRLFPDYEGEVVEISSRSFNFVTTPDHRWLVTSPRGVIKERTTDTLKNGELIHRTGMGIQDGNGSVTPDQAELWGWFVTDGYYRRSEGASRPWSYGGKKAYLVQSEVGNPEKSARIQALLDRLAPGETTKYTDIDGKSSWRLGKRLSKLLNDLAPDRTLVVSALLGLDRQALERLHEAMVLGDGHKWTGNAEWSSKECFVTGRKNQADVYQVLLTMLGKASACVWRDMSKYEPRSVKLLNVPKMTGCYVVTTLQRDVYKVDSDHFSRSIRKVGVWCPIVPNTFFVARRRGQVTITGNTPVRPHELMHAHMVDTWEDLGIDPRDPDFHAAHGHYFGKDQGKNYPRNAGDYFRAHKDVHLKNPSKGSGREAGELMGFMLGEEKFHNIAQYHKLHQTLVDLVKKHGTNARAATAELMAMKSQHRDWQTKRRAFTSKLKDKIAAEHGLGNHLTDYVDTKVAEERAGGRMGKSGTQNVGDAAKRAKFEEEGRAAGLGDHLNDAAENAAQEKFGDYQGTAVPGLAPKTGRFTFTMLGGGNSFVPDTHIVRHLFGMQGGVDKATLGHLKEALWEPDNHHVLEAIDRWYAKNHPAAKLMQEHPKWGPEFKDDKEQANFPAFWRHWCAIAQDERNRGMSNGTAQNEFSTHEPFWTGIHPLVKAEPGKPIDDKMLAKMLALHKQYEADYGEVPAQMMFFNQIVPHLIEAGQFRERHDDLSDFVKSVERDLLGIELRKSAADIEIAKFSDPTVPSVHSVNYKTDDGWHRAGRYVLHNGNLQHLEDYHGLLGDLLPEGPVTMKTVSAVHALKMSPHLQIDVDNPDLKEGEDKDEQETDQTPADGASQVQPEVSMRPRPPSVFEYQRTGHDRPHTIEVHDGVYMMDGNRLTYPEIQLILENRNEGIATIRYKGHHDPVLNDVQKMELVITDLMKGEDEDMDEDTLLQHSRAAEAAGHLPKGYSAAQAKHLYGDPMAPGMGNKKAWQNFSKKGKPGTYVQMDGNDFKAINDIHGHAAGDSAIHAFGSAAREAMDEAVGKENGKLFRNGGDEFIAHVPSQEHAANFSRALSEKLRAVPPIGGTHQLSMSFGFGQDPHTADKALMQAKTQKIHPVTGQRMYKVGQVPNLAHSLVPGNEGALPVHDKQADLLHTQLKPAPAMPKTTVPVAASPAPSSA